MSDQPQALTSGNEDVAFFEKPGQGLGMPKGEIDKDYVGLGRCLLDLQVRKSSQLFGQEGVSLRRSIVFIWGTRSAHLATTAGIAQTGQGAWIGAEKDLLLQILVAETDGVGLDQPSDCLQR